MLCETSVTAKGSPSWDTAVPAGGTVNLAVKMTLNFIIVSVTVIATPMVPATWVCLCFSTCTARHAHGTPGPTHMLHCAHRVDSWMETGITPGVGTPNGSA